MERYEQIIQTSPDLIVDYFSNHSQTMVLLLNENLNILDCNKAFTSFYNLKEKPVHQNLLSYIKKEDIKTLLADPSMENPMHTQLTVPGNDSTLYLVHCILFSLEDKYLMFWENMTLGETEVVEKMSVLNEELTNMTRELSKKNAELKKANDRITSLLRTDPLTGIYNRRFFMEELERAFALRERHQIPFSVIMADLDNFKKINDNWGHAAGDKVLSSIARLFQDNCRKEDIPARIGGEEFAILLNSTAFEQALTFAERLREKIETHVTDPLPHSLTCSFGVTQVSAGDTVDTVMQRVDEALYDAKKAGRNRVAQSKA